MSNKSLPTVTSDIPRDLRNFIDRLREMLGSSGTDRFVTAKELASTGVVGTTGSGALVNPANVVQVSTPANPGVLTVSSAIQNIMIEWATPRYAGHAYAEVWGNGTNNLGTAVKIGVAPGNSYVDSVGPSVSRYYWVRFINVANVEGPFNSVNGTLGETGPAVEYLLSTLTSAALDPDSPYSKFAVRADLFYVAPDLDFNQETAPTATAIGQLWYKPSTQVTMTWNGALWDTFTTTLPFIVNSVPQTINGVLVPAGVYMDAAFIKNGTITNAKIGNAAIDDAKIFNLSAGKITSGFIDAARIQAGSLDAKIANIDAAVIGSGIIANARIGNLDAGKITTGSFNASLITTGTLSADRINGGTLSGVSLLVGSGPTPRGGLFEVTSSGILWAANMFVGILYASNYYSSTGHAVYGVTATGRNIEAIVGVVENGNSGSNAHGLRGVNYTQNTAGIIGCANGYDFYADGGGTNYGPFTGTHDSLVPIGDTFTVGDIIVDKEIFERNGISSTIAVVGLSTTANQKSVVGVVCAIPTPLSGHNPAVFIASQESEDYLDENGDTRQRAVVTMKPSYEQACALYNHMAINALGEGQINVCGEGGDLEVGDLISSSSVPGKGMRQADDLVRNITVAKVREAVTFSSPTEVKQVACIYMCG